MSAAEPAGALAAVPGAGSRRGLPMSASLRFYFGPMDCGKSTLALQIDHNHARQGRCGLVLTQGDRSAGAQITTRVGMSRAAVELGPATDLWALVRAHWAAGQRVDYLIVDEAQFLTAEQVEQLVDLVDNAHVDVYAFGLASDFRSRLSLAASDYSNSRTPSWPCRWRSCAGVDDRVGSTAGWSAAGWFGRASGW